LKALKPISLSAVTRTCQWFERSAIRRLPIPAASDLPLDRDPRASYAVWDDGEVQLRREICRGEVGAKSD